MRLIAVDCIGVVVIIVVLFASRLSDCVVLKAGIPVVAFARLVLRTREPISLAVSCEERSGDYNGPGDMHGAGGSSGNRGKERGRLEGTAIPHNLLSCISIPNAPE
jgi:hypothetical protein